ncbi:phage protein NinX family protein [Paucimonas lemoignei]|uniref:phage protein NinX family protein n=1 Tax=Paucimonas lemoignei TaxID=29443 RepID=UPI00104A3A5A|nr:phage protein NinX family protein [Paucimonas lemoignei]
MKTSDLTDFMLDYYTAVAVYGDGVKVIDGYIRPPFEYPGWSDGAEYSPSTDWKLGGALMDKYDIEIRRLPPHGYAAEFWIDLPGGDAAVFRGMGSSRLIAITRAIVRSKFGDEVPDEIPRS